MADDTDHDSAADVGHDLEDERTTAPMSEYTASDVTVGFVVMLIGVAVAFGIPLIAF
ncbi:hypothetical protein SAMN05444422_103406 [Halobiforma haloterrestris]|uniref:Uncharacterized protein n=2 Tax=Natronobacterium TaxID=2256 RepID=M0LCK2_NATLA|nr:MULTISPECIES: hypothetical protein [Halobiforma]EMA31297.1 hypothetical protein C445_14614 [Halobiforma lacisalsi AJ5]SFB99441.1 hypothetical protein SAMN05444422_103406 [Halobiforma haloterrestris]